MYHLNFISPISRQRLEDLAAGALQSNCVANIHGVFDQYVNFITLEDDMFILKHQNSDLLSYYGKIQFLYHLVIQNIIKIDFQQLTEQTQKTSKWKE